MGADIHGPFLEIRKKHTDLDFKSTWQLKCQFHVSRDYWLFSLLANVRNYNDFPALEPKGYPKDASVFTNSEFYYYIREGDDGFCESNVCTKAQAKHWVSNGTSWFQPDNDRFVSDPDAHSCSWLTTKELAQVLEAYLKLPGVLDDSDNSILTLKSILAAMREFESEEGTESRIVFWFDN
jgi:hypothetical protein